MAQITIAILSEKGGVGKSTLALSLATASHLGGARTLLIDADKQGSTTWWSAQRTDPALDGLTVVKQDVALRLPRFRELARDYDCVVIDGPPRLGDVTRSAACFADVALIPLQPGAFDMVATGETLALLDTADGVRADLGKGPIRRCLALNRAVSGSSIARQTPGLMEGAGELVGVVHQRLAFTYATANGSSVLLAEPNGEAAREVRRLAKALGIHGVKSEVAA
jgi:chromosome partitioning protein